MKKRINRQTLLGQRTFTSIWEKFNLCYFSWKNPERKITGMHLAWVMEIAEKSNVLHILLVGWNTKLKFQTSVCVMHGARTKCYYSTGSDVCSLIIWRVQQRSRPARLFLLGGYHGDVPGATRRLHHSPGVPSKGKTTPAAAHWAASQLIFGPKHSGHSPFRGD